MKPDALSFDLYAMVEPKTHGDFMALANEALAEIACFRAHIASIRCSEKNVMAEEA